MSTQHTPGPWMAAAARSSIVGLPIVAPHSVGRVIANSYQPGDEGLANARLIAAAPELLDALCGLLPEGWNDGTMDHMPGVKAARLAIAKATQP